MNEWSTKWMSTDELIAHDRARHAILNLLTTRKRLEGEIKEINDLVKKVRTQYQIEWLELHGLYCAAGYYCKQQTSWVRGF